MTAASPSVAHGPPICVSRAAPAEARAGGVAPAIGCRGPAPRRRADRPNGAAVALPVVALLAMLATEARAASVPVRIAGQVDRTMLLATGTLDIERYVGQENQGEQALAAALRERLRPRYAPEDVIALLAKEGFRCSEVNRMGVWSSCSYRVRVKGPVVKSVLVLVKVRRGSPSDFSVEFAPLKF
jgi:hypothetical protein